MLALISLGVLESGGGVHFFELFGICYSKRNNLLLFFFGYDEKFLWVDFFLFVIMMFMELSFGLRGNKGSLLVMRVARMLGFSVM